MPVIATDDEVVASAVRSGRPWDGLLPTLAVSTDGVVLVAAARGVRSLLIRGLMNGADASLVGDGAELGALTSGPVVLRGFSAMTERPLVPVGPGITVVRADRERVIDVTIADGTHDIAQLDAERGWVVIRNLLEAIYETGLAEGKVFTVIVERPGGTSGLMLAVSRGEANDYDVTVDDQGDAVLDLVVSGELDAAIGRLRQLWPDLGRT